MTQLNVVSQSVKILCRAGGPSYLNWVLLGAGEVQSQELHLNRRVSIAHQVTLRQGNYRVQRREIIALDRQGT